MPVQLAGPVHQPLPGSHLPAVRTVFWPLIVGLPDHPQQQGPSLSSLYLHSLAECPALSKTKSNIFFVWVNIKINIFGFVHFFQYCERWLKPEAVEGKQLDWKSRYKLSLFELISFHRGVIGLRRISGISQKQGLCCWPSCPLPSACSLLCCPFIAQSPHSNQEWSFWKM